MNSKYKTKSARALAYEVLFKFERTLDRLDDLSERALAENEISSRERRLFKNLTAGVVRHRLYLDWIGAQLYKGRYQKLLIKFKVLLRMALYELIYLTAIPAHATLNEYVGLTRKKLNDLQSKIMNGMLRSFLRKKPVMNPDQSVQEPVQRISIKYSFPEWLVKRWIGFWGEQETEALCAALNEPPDFDIRINPQKISVAKFKKLLLKEKVPFKETKYDPQVIRVKDIQPFLRHRWFEKGYCVVQDESAAMVTRQIDMEANDLVLDMCAAPGGKYVQLLQNKPQGAMVMAMDIDFRRLQRVRENVNYLNLDGGHFVVADGRHLPFKKKFNAILIDAPCTGLGVIRKHPDIKWRRRFEEIFEFAEIQKALMEEADHFLATGGQLIYSTCTVDYFENENVVQEFMEKHGDAYTLLHPKAPDASMNQDGFLRLFPHKHQTDGSFCARLRKK